MRARDVVIVLVCAIATMVAWQQEGSVVLAPGFVSPMLSRHVLPAPIVGDLDGNGTPETLLVNPADTVVILTTHLVRGTAETQFAQELHPKFTATLSANCIGLAAGILDFPNATLPPNLAKKKRLVNRKELRKKTQHIAVVTDDYRLTLYDHHLSEVWSTAIVESENAYMVPRRASVVVLPDKVYADDEGMIVVGVVTAAQGSAARTTYIAFNGATGEVRWRHSAGNEASDVAQGDDELTPDNFKFSEKALAAHARNLHWTDFRESVISALPHAYTHPWDAKLAPFQFTTEKSRKKRSPLRKGKGASTKDKMRIDLAHGGKVDAAFGELGERLESFGSAADVAKGKKIHLNLVRPLPNTLVSHFAHGIHIVHLFTGRIVTEMTTLKRGVTYDDINDDLRIDAVSTRIGNFQERFGRHGVDESFKCQGTIDTNIPASADAMLKTGICDSQGYFASLSSMRHMIQHAGKITSTPSTFSAHDPLSLIGSRNVGDDKTTAVTPIVVHHRHSKGRNIFEQRRLAIFLVSNGLMTAVDARTKTIAWRLDTAAVFDSKRRMRDVQGGDANEAHRSSFNSVDQEDERDTTAKTHAHVAPYNFHTRFSDPTDVRNVHWARHKHDPLLLAVGHDVVVMVDTVHGTTEASIALDSPPVAPAIIADFNGDGTNDIIILTEKGYTGFVVHKHRSGSVLSLLMLLTVACIGALFVSQRMMRPGGLLGASTEEEREDAAFAGFDLGGLRDSGFDDSEMRHRNIGKRATD
jgi:hypothetical protein